MSEVLDWLRGDPRQVVRRAVEELAAGKLVVLPTETGYQVGASMRHPQAIAAIGGVAAVAQAAQALSSVAAALELAPSMSSTARRLAKRIWPGPVVLVVADQETSKPGVVGEGGLRLCVPMHPVPRAILEQLGCPLLLAPLNSGGASTAQLTLDLGEHAALIINDESPAANWQTTLVEVCGLKWKVIQIGTITAEMLQALMPTTVLFVCTGNTCRSPLAEAFCKKLLAERLGCGLDELPERGFLVLSAGLAAMPGAEASAQAILVARDLGADLTGHRSQPLTADLLARADYLFTMTQNHLRALLPFCPETGSAPRLLAPDGSDVPDPIGAEPEVYRDCAERILRHLQDCLPSIQPLG